MESKKEDMRNRNKIRTALAAGLTVLLGSALAAPALAAGEGGPEGPGAPGGDSTPITGVAPTSGDLVIHKFIGALAAAPKSDGTQLDTSGWTGVTPVNGVAFDLYQVGAPVNPQPPTDPWADVPPQGTYVKNASGNLDVYAGSNKVGEYALTAASSPQVTTGTNGTGTASGLPQGLYLVIENAAASTSITNANTGEAMFISQTAAPFIVPVPMTSPTGDGWLDVVHVYPKNEALTVDKVVEQKGAVAVGDTMHYTITTSVPTDVANGTKFQIFDKLDAALDYVDASATVATVPALTAPNALVLGTDYTVTYDKPSRTLLVAFTPAGLPKLDGLASVVVELDSTINSTILTYADFSVPNVANVEFTNSDGTDFASESDPTGGSEVHSAAIKITKVDEAGQPLNGAKFKIATSEANAKAGQFLRINPTSKQLFDVGDLMWTILNSDNDYEISPSNSASFTGLRDQVDVNGTMTWQTYWVVETAAPATYNLLSAPIKVDFQDAFNKVADPADYDHVYSATVKNSQGFMLPETGGMGTIVWTVAGVVLVGVAVLIVATRRKKDVTQ